MNFEVLAKNKLRGVAWRVNTTHTAYFDVGNNSVLWKTRGNLERHIRDHLNIIRGLSPRPIFAVPRLQGVCLPYVFIQDDGRTIHSASVTYRFMTHPDVLVVVEDSNAFTSDTNSFRRSHSLREFWSQYEYSGTVQKIDSLWHMPIDRTLRVKGLAGTASFVKITRRDGAEDYGYLAIIAGESEQKRDASRIQIFATRDAMLAHKKGFVPISQSAFLSLIESVANSITRVNSE